MSSPNTDILQKARGSTCIKSSLLLLCLLMMSGCFPSSLLPSRVGGDGESTPDEIILTLREENAELKTKLDQAVNTRLAEIKKRESLEALLNQEENIKWQGSQRPTLSTIALDRFSGLIDQDQDGAYDHLRLYVLTLDEKQRFLLTLGTLHVIVTHGDERTSSQEWMRLRIDEKELDDMYRTGLMGARYRVLIPLSESWPLQKRKPTSQTPGDPYTEVSLKLIFEEAQSGNKQNLVTSLKQFPVTQN